MDEKKKHLWAHRLSAALTEYNLIPQTSLIFIKVNLFLLDVKLLVNIAH